MSGSGTLPAEFSEVVRKAADAIRSRDQVRVVSHYDADGISAAAIVSAALHRAGLQFHLTMSKGLDDAIVEDLVKEGNETILFLDMGSGQIDALDSLDAKVFALDHHKPVRKSKKVVQVNPHFFGIDGMTEACAASLSLLFAVSLDERNWDLSPIALAGIVGDRQHMGGMKGVNIYILERALELKHITSQKSLNLKGSTLVDAISGSVDPYFVGLSGRRENTLAFLESMNLNPDLSLGSLDEFYRRKLTSMLSLRLMGQGCRPETVEELVTDIHWIPTLDMSTSDLADLLNACGRLDNEGLGVAMSLGDVDAIAAAKDLRTEYNKRLLDMLMKIESDGVEDMDNLQFFDASDPSLAGAQCGLAMQYILDQSRPTLALSEVGDGTKVSSRGTKYLVSKGLDLAAALKKSAEAVGGRGGGHAVAAGASFPTKVRAEFLKNVDSTVGSQLK
jgi:single-stranded-DNA-specific exonuclease